jgi:hypothetical protein
MKLEFAKHCNLYIYRWHSINLIPSIGFHNVASNNKVDPIHGCLQWDGTLVGRVVEITFFGFIINFMYPNTKFKKQWSSKLRSPLWSRKRKCWYFIEDNK